MAGDRSFFELGQKNFLHCHFIFKEQQNHLGDHEFSQKWDLTCILVHPTARASMREVVDIYDYTAEVNKRGSNLWTF